MRKCGIALCIFNQKLVFSGVVALATEHCRFNPIVNERLTEQSLEGILAMDTREAYFKEFSTLYDAGLDQTSDYGSILRSLKTTLQKDLYAPYLGKIAEKWNILHHRRIFRKF